MRDGPTLRTCPVVDSPVGSAGLDMTPALPLREDPRRRPGTSKWVELHLLPLLSSLVSLDHQPDRILSTPGWPTIRLCHRQPVVVPLVVVPEGVVLSLVLNAELHCAGRLEDLRYRHREGEGVGVGAAVDVVQVQTRNVLEGAPRVKGDPDRHRLVKGEVSDLNGAGEKTLLDRTSLQTNLLGSEPVPQVQIVCSWRDEVQK